MFGKTLIFAAALLAVDSFGARAQTVTNLKHGSPPDGVVYGFLLTDGRLFFQGGNLNDWYLFQPDKTGSYVDGSFSKSASLPSSYVPYATSGGVLPDGRVLLIGGEYLLTGFNLTFELTNKMAVYDPKGNTWTMVQPPKNWDFIGDSPWTILSDGRLLLGQKLTTNAAILDPKTLTWTEVATPGKNDFNAEEGWTLLPDGSVLTIDVKDHPQAERFIPNASASKTKWVKAGPTPANLQASDTNSEKKIVFDNGKIVYYPPGEIGPAILRPDGSVFATGAVCGIPGTGGNDCQVLTTVGHTAIFKGASWTAGPNFPNGEGAGDSFANLLPNGHVLVETNPAGNLGDAQTRYARIASHAIHPVKAGEAPLASTTWHFYEFDGVHLTYEPAADFIGGQASTLLLPNGEVMLNGQAVYATKGTYVTAWAPTITKAPTKVSAGATYSISGTQFNGLSQANSYGDEFGVATNFPLVRIKNDKSGDVVYAHTHDPTSMGVATGREIVSTSFDAPKSIELGASTLEVVANGIPSKAIPITVGAASASGD